MLEYIYSVSKVAVDELRRQLERNGLRLGLVLLDVRQPLEYQAGHIPGAILIPVGGLADRLDELDPQDEIIVYCADGVRSRAAAKILLHHGFQQVRHLPGGFRAWQGLRAHGAPVTSLEVFATVQSPEQHVALAWLLEEGAREFYQQLGRGLKDEVGRQLFTGLASEEEGHKQTLLAVYEGLTKLMPASDFPAGVLPEEIGTDLMEGGFRVAEALEMAKGADLAAVCELALAVESNAYDHYLYLQRVVADENSRRVFEVLAGEERRHLQRLGDALDEILRRSGNSVG
ncbi:MAG TPA: rhodanese-like domain-containing protein [Geothermobacteraceae bacterium]|nr:rhodanese-like domain-containing protein [Geothermobacteraceae bacterium]